MRHESPKVFKATKEAPSKSLLEGIATDSSISKETAPTVKAVQQQQFYRPKEACSVLRIGMATLYRRIKAGDIKATKFGGATLIAHSEIERVTNPDENAIE